MKLSELEAVLKDSPYVAKSNLNRRPGSRVLVGPGLTLLGPGRGQRKVWDIELKHGEAIALETDFSTQSQRLRRYGFIFSQGDSWYKCLNGKISPLSNMDMVTSSLTFGASASRPDWRGVIQVIYVSVHFWRRSAEVTRGTTVQWEVRPGPAA